MPKSRLSPRSAVVGVAALPPRSLHADPTGVPASQALPALAEHSVSVSVRVLAPRVGPLSFLLQVEARALEPQPTADDRRRRPPLSSSGERCAAAMTPTRASVNPAPGHGAPRSPPCCGWRGPRTL